MQLGIKLGLELEFPGTLVLFFLSHSFPSHPRIIENNGPRDNELLSMLATHLEPSEKLLKIQMPGAYIH